MDQKAVFYDGSFHVEETSNEEIVTPSPFPITDEVRKNLAANPFSFELTE